VEIFRFSVFCVVVESTCVVFGGGDGGCCDGVILESLLCIC